MALGRPCWIDITVTDAEDREHLVAFLCEIFDWTYEVTGPDTGNYTMLRHDGVDVAAVGQRADGSERWITFLSTDDMDVSVRRVREAGAAVVSEPVTVMRAGTMAVATDPVGAAFGLWQPDLFAGFPDIIEPGYPEWFHHGSPDPRTAAQFYAQAFDLDQQAEGRDLMLGRAGRAFFSLGHNIEGVPADIRPVILVGDVDEVEARVVESGGTIYASKVEVPGGLATTFVDPVVGAPLIASVNAL